MASSRIHFPSLQLPPADPVSHPWRRRWLGTRFYWVMQLLGWGAMVVFLAWTIYASKSDKKYTELICVVLWAGTGVFTTHLLRVILIYGRSRPLSRLVLLTSLGFWTTAATLALACGTMLEMYFVAWLVGPAFDISAKNDPMEFSDFVIIDLLALIPWVSLYFGLNYYRSFQRSLLEKFRLQAAVREAELRSLRAQVDPHFLFNSLNTLRALIPRELTAPREAVTLLSEVLRTSLTSSARAAVPFAEELEHIDNYLALEKLRLEQRLSVRQTIVPAARTYLVPTLLVQTLVENAVKYGVATREAGGEITLRAEIQNGILCITVSNPGRLDLPSASTGLGIKNARARLALIFGTEASLALLQVEPDLVCAELRVPLLAEAPTKPFPAALTPGTRE